MEQMQRLFFASEPSDPGSIPNPLSVHKSKLKCRQISFITLQNCQFRAGFCTGRTLILGLLDSSMFIFNKFLKAINMFMFYQEMYAKMLKKQQVPISRLLCNSLFT